MINGFTEKDLDKLINSSDPLTSKAGRTLLLLSSDLEARMFISTSNVINRICEDMDLLSEGNILRNLKDDKVFERVNLFVRSIPDYSKNVQEGIKRLEQLGMKEKKEEEPVGGFFKKNGSRKS